MNLSFFSLYSDYSYPFTLTIVGEPPEAEFQGTIFKLRKRNKISSLLVYVLYKRRNQAFLRRSRAKTGKKWTKKCDARAKLLFCLLIYCFFLRSRCRPRRWILKSLMMRPSARGLRFILVSSSMVKIVRNIETCAIYLVYSSTFWVCGWNPMVWPFK